MQEGAGGLSGQGGARHALLHLRHRLFARQHHHLRLGAEARQHRQGLHRAYPRTRLSRFAHHHRPAAKHRRGEDGAKPGEGGLLHRHAHRGEHRRRARGGHQHARRQGAAHIPRQAHREIRHGHEELSAHHARRFPHRGRLQRTGQRLIGSVQRLPATAARRLAARQTGARQGGLSH